MNGNGTASPTRSRFAALFAATGILGKDLVRYLPVQLTVTLLGLAACYLVPYLTLIRRGYLPGSGPDANAGRLAGIMAAIALAAGLAASTEEEESRSRQFLETLPCPRRGVVLAKIVAALLHTLAGGILTFLALTVAAGSTAWFTIAFSGGQLWHLGTVPFDGLSVILLVMACMLTSLAAGTLLGSVVPAGTATVLVCGCAMWGTHAMAESRGMGLTDQRVMWVSLGAWTFAAALAYPLAWSVSRDRPPSDGQTEWLWFVDVLRRPLRRIRLRPRIAAHMLAPVTLGILVLAAGVAWHGLAKPNMVSELAAILYVFCGPLIGVCAWTRSERERSRGLVHSLPLSRGQFYAARMRAVVFYSLVAGIGGGLLLQAGGARTFMGPILDFPVATVVGAVVAAILMLFVRMKLVTMLLSLMLTLPWSVTAAIVIGTIRNQNSWSPSLPMGIWCLGVSVALPWLVGYVAFARSNLLEQTEGQRALVLMLVLPWLLVWGCGLMVLAPAYLLEYLSF